MINQTIDQCKHEPNWEVAKHYLPGQYTEDDGKFWSSFKCKHCGCDGELTIKVERRNYEWYDRDPDGDDND